MAVVNPILNPNVKDSRWLTLEVCREHQRNKCTRTENECKFAHPPAHVEVQNGRVIACFDSIKGKCQRKDPPCKYLHPPQHLREQLLQNGRNNLILRSLQMQAYHPQMIGPSIIPVAGAKTVAYPSAMVPGQIPYVATAVPQSRPAHVSAHPASYVTFASSSSATAPTPQYLTAVPTTAVAQFNPYGLPTMAMQNAGAADGTIVTSQFPGVITSPVPTKAPARPDRLETQVVEVVPQSKKRLRDSAEELVLPSYMIPPYKRLAVDGGGLGGKGGVPAMYHQPTYSATAAAAAAYQQATLMQLQQQQQQQPSYPLNYSNDVVSAAYANYLPQVAGHPPSVPRF